MNTMNQNPPFVLFSDPSNPNCLASSGEVLNTIYHIACGRGTPDVEQYRSGLSNLSDHEERVTHAAAQWKVTTFSVMLTYVDPSTNSNKFWCVEKTQMDSHDFVIRWGRLGTTGQQMVVNVPDGYVLLRWHDANSLITKKVKEGYALSVCSVRCDTTYSHVRGIKKGADKNILGGVSYVGYLPNRNHWNQTIDITCALLDCRYNVIAHAPEESIRGIFF